MLPLVSVLTPTYNRPQMLARAIRTFLSYRYPRKEMIVVDDSPKPFDGRIPAAVKYIRLERRTILGRKHNTAAAQAQGEIFVHRDDDDLYSPMSLAREIEPILMEKADLSGFIMNWIREEKTGRFFHFRRDAKFVQSNPTTLPLYRFHDSNSAYHRRVWDAGVQYTIERVAQKLHFLNAALRAGFRSLALPNRDEFVYSRHDVNTWQFNRQNLQEASAPMFSQEAWFQQLVGQEVAA
jgi:glycosyltransferase involved in cell wall biosynthesis